MDEATKNAVRERAKDCCEYCQLPALHVRPRKFHFEHIRAKKHRGTDSLGNLAYSCHRCNLHKSSDLTGIDPKTQKLTRIFNPRRHRWSTHFAWEGAILVGKTAIGRTTILVLAMNDPLRVAIRQELIGRNRLPVFA